MSWEQRGGAIVRYLAHDLQLELFQAAGIVGNLGYESGELRSLQEVAPIVPGSRGGYGWAQWTGPRRRAFEAFAQERGLDPASDEANYGFLVHEFKGEFKGLLAQLRLCKTVEEAANMVHTHYERPADVQDGSYRSGAARLQYARRALAGLRPAKPIFKIEQAIKAHNRESLRLQKALAAAGHDPGPLDGDWGERSRRAKLAYLRMYHPAEGT